MRRLVYLLLSLPLFFLLCSCNSLKINDCGSFYVMNTYVTVTFYNEENPVEHYKKIKSLYYSVDEVCSDFEENGNNVYLLNQNRKIEASDLLIDICNEAIKAKNNTNGYFNPFIGKITHLWKDSLNNNRIPDSDVLKAYLEEMNNTSLKIEGNTLELIGDGNLDLGGIAKGYATYLVQNYLKDSGVKYYFINAGQSNVLLSSKADNNFNVAFKNPLSNGSYFKVSTSNVSIGTSSVEYQHCYIEDILYHHIISPYTGMPQNYYESVNVFCNSSLDADVYSTALFSMPVEEAKEFASKNDLKIILYKAEILYKSEALV